MTKIKTTVPKLCSKCKPLLAVTSPEFKRDWSDRLQYRPDLDAWLTDNQYADVLDLRQEDEDY